MAKYEVVNGVGIIPEGVTEIVESAFEDCTSLTSVVIPEGVTAIGNSAFCECTSLTSVVIPEGETEIGNYAFYNCTSLTSIEIPSSVTEIGRSALKGCTSLTSIVVEEGNSTYDSREGCNAIIETATNELIQGCKSTIIPSSVTAIGDEAFYGFTSLTSVEIPSSVTEIGYYAFYGCTSLTSIEIPSSVTVIGWNAFEDCESLTSVVIPKGVTKIYESTFSGCTSLTSVVINGKINKIEESTFSYTGLESITLPSSIKAIGESAFSGCTSLTSIVIPEHVTEIRYYAFEDCTGLESITLPAGVEKIYDNAFEGCTSIKTINVPAKTKKYYANLLPEELHSLIVEMEPIKKTKGRDVSYGIWRIVRTEDNRTEVYKNDERCPKSAPALREICEELGIEVNPKATTEDLRNKVQKAVLELAQYPIFDFKFKKVDWELNEENIEKRREEIDFYGAIYVIGISEDGDFNTRVIVSRNIADGLYAAMVRVKDFIYDGWDEVEVYYTTDCNMYGLDDYDSDIQNDTLGYVLSSALGDYYGNYLYNINIPVICRIVWEDDSIDSIICQITDSGYYDTDIDCDVDALIAYKKQMLA